MMTNANAAITRLEKRPEKVFRLWMGFEPMTFVLPMQCSPNWAIKSTGEWSCVGWPFMFSGHNTQLKYVNFIVIDVFQVFLPVVLWLHSHLSSCLHLIATVGHVASHQGGSRNTPSHFMLQNLQEISTGLTGYLACMQTLPFAPWWSKSLHVEYIV